MCTEKSLGVGVLGGWGSVLLRVYSYRLSFFFFFLALPRAFPIFISRNCYRDIN